jgi:hypothetical protein
MTRVTRAFQGQPVLCALSSFSPTFSAACEARAHTHTHGRARAQSFAAHFPEVHFPCFCVRMRTACSCATLHCGGTGKATRAPQASHATRSGCPSPAARQPRRAAATGPAAPGRAPHSAGLKERRRRR